jgi:RIO kinase 1
LCSRYHEGQLYIIDVSQSVENDHPLAMEFLRKDCTNITSFFGRRHNVCTMTVKELFDFITDVSISESNVDAYLAKAMDLASTRSGETTTNEEQIDEEVCWHCDFYCLFV